MQKKVVIIGGGAAGLMAAYASATEGKKTVLIEKNEKLGKKLYITGKGRCNLTNEIPVADFMQNIVSNAKFMYGSLNGFSPSKTIEFFSSRGLKLKTERGNRVFPESDRASDVTKCLENACKEAKVDILLNTKVIKILTNGTSVVGVLTDKGEIEADSVIVCTGGLSYSSTGSTGDGYGFALKLGHAVVEPKAALVGIELFGEYRALQGLSLKNVRLTAKLDDKIVFTDFGEMLFTHFGISGPIALSCSSAINRLNLSKVRLFIDLKPALSDEVLDKRLLREFDENRKKNIVNVMPSLLPVSLCEPVLERANVKKSKNCSEITVAERKSLIEVLKNFSLKVKGLRPIEEAIVTSGGVSVKEINPKTMESKLVKGLFFAGEVMDIDAFTGGFNIQLALSSGFAAGKNA